MRARIAMFVVIVQTILFLGHWFVYQTWTAFRQAADPPGMSALQVTFALLSVSFVVASLLSWRSSAPLVRVFYTFSAVWLGVGSFLLLAAFVCWVLYGAFGLFGLGLDRRAVVTAVVGIAG